MGFPVKNQRRESAASPISMRAISLEVPAMQEYLEFLNARSAGLGATYPAPDSI